jgi:hypothetical protein
MNTKWRIATATFAAGLGLNAGAAVRAQADEDWHYCSEVDNQLHCVTCFQNTPCGSAPVCCKIY